jgi:hypothetical protein
VSQGCKLGQAFFEKRLTKIAADDDALGRLLWAGGVRQGAAPPVPASSLWKFTARAGTTVEIACL